MLLWASANPTFPFVGMQHPKIHRGVPKDLPERVWVQGAIIVKWNRPINVSVMFERSAIEQTSSAEISLATLIGRFHFTITISN